MARICVAATSNGKNENYKNLRKYKALFILRSGGIVPDASSNSSSKPGHDHPPVRREAPGRARFAEGERIGPVDQFE
jgi:hypothetical protein